MPQVGGIKLWDIWDVGIGFVIGILTFGILGVDIGDDLVSPRWEESS